MKIGDSSPEDYSKILDDKIRKTNIRKSQDLEDIKKFYDKKIEDAKDEGEKHYINSRSIYDDKVIGANKDYETKLSEYKQNLDRVHKNVEQSELALKTEHEEKTKNLKDQFSNSIYDQYQNASEDQHAISNEIRNTVQSVADKSRFDKNRLEANSKIEVNALAMDYNQKGINEERDFRAKLTNDIHVHEDEVRTQKEEFKKLMDKDVEQSKRLQSEKIQINKNELDYLDNHQKEMLAQRNADFKVRYENMVKEHDAILNDIKSKLDHDVKKMVESTATQKRIIANKSDDQFYRVETLNPTVAENEKEFLVSLKVPEHEKENVHLSAHGREVKLTLTRKYTDSLDAEDGSNNKFTRNELYSKEFSSKEILNPKLITQKYEDGVLSYKIQKL